MNSISEDLAFSIIKYFQGYSQQKKNIIEKAKVATHYEFDLLIQQYKKHAKLKTDVKSILNLSETNRFFYRFIRCSDFGKLIWVAYYNSLFPLKIREDSYHIGDQTWSKCSLGMSYPGVDKINDVVDPSNYRCCDPSHYVNNEHETCKNWSIQTLFKKIAMKRYSMLKNEGQNWSKSHEIRLANLYDRLDKTQIQINELERKKRASEMDLDSLFGYWIKNKNSILNETKVSEPEQDNSWTDSDSQSDSSDSEN